MDCRRIQALMHAAIRARQEFSLEAMNLEYHACQVWYRKCMAEEQIDYFRNNDYQTGHRLGITDAVNGLAYEDMTNKGYIYQHGYEDGWKWAKAQFSCLDQPNSEE